jgi:uncharacterized protein YqjF (DUF2071 family)
MAQCATGVSPERSAERADSAALARRLWHTEPRRAPLLAAEWRDLVTLNFVVDPCVLAPHVPPGTELDAWHGNSFVSIVGFRFLNVRLLGVPMPFHASFPEVNLRFYVRRRVADGWRHGVVFLRELVPKRAVAWVARALGENFGRVPMTIRIERSSADQAPSCVQFQWRCAGGTHRLALETAGQASRPPEPGTLDQFIVEHYWAYTALPRRRMREHFVVHPPWQVAPATSVDFDADVRELYGPQFAPFLSRRPASAFWADGSAVRVYKA